jgi:uncharacterized membrane protein
MTKNLSEEKLDSLISYILIIGVTASVAIETLGVLSYFQASGTLDIVFQPQYALSGTDFFAYCATILSEITSWSWTPFQILGLGILLLMITPYIRVVASVAYFILVRNVKYVFITLFVLVVLTASLLFY